MTENDSAATAETRATRTRTAVAVPTKRLVSCGWCDSTHIADVTCTCKEPCARGWCPAAADAEYPFVHVQRDAVA